MFVVDSNDRDRIDQTKDDLWRIITDDQLKNCPVLIMANKQDLPNAMSVTELTDKLELKKIEDKSWRKYYTCTHALIVMQTHYSTHAPIGSINA